MKKLRTRFNRFCLRNRDKGIPNLMLYIAIGNAIVLLMTLINSGIDLYGLLCFDKGKILQGQVWRLVTYVFTQSGGGFIELIFLYFFYMVGRHVELSMGTLKFNLFYFSGVLLMDIFALVFCPIAPAYASSQEEYNYLITVLPIYYQMAYYLHLSLILTFATTHPDSQFMIFFIIPIKAWVISLIYLVLTLISVFNLSYPVFYFPHTLFPLVALGNYFLFTGSEIINLVPLSWRMKLRRKSAPKSQGPKVIRFETTGPYRPAPKKEDFLHKCTVCGRTDTDNPELEFRYCSRCKGYHCYCIDHINNHEHIEM